MRRQREQRQRPTQIVLTPPESTTSPVGLLGEDQRPRLLDRAPIYATRFGAAYLGDAEAILSELPAGSANLVVTSPPYALHFKKEYGNADKHAYVEWFRPIARQIFRVLRENGSFVLNIGGSYNGGAPTRSLYHFRVLLMLCDEIGFRLAQECFWHNPAKLPAPAEWVNVRRVRIKDSVEYIWWLSKSDHPKADNRNVLVPYSKDMLRLIERGYRPKRRPSGHNITDGFNANHGGAIPSNLIDPTDLIECGNNESNSDYIKLCEQHGIKPHPARFPSALPEFFIRLLSCPGDLVVDPFAGSNTTGAVAERLQRRWITADLQPAYVAASALRFGLTPPSI